VGDCNFRLYAAKFLAEYLRKSKRAAKVTHLKNQNTIGASIVHNYMSQTMSFMSTKDGPLGPAVDKASNLLGFLLNKVFLFLFLASCNAFVHVPVPVHG